jgi:hypothetical protein
MKWVHNALRQLANTQKAEATVVRAGENKALHNQRHQAVANKVAEEIRLAGKDPDSEVPDVVFAQGSKKDLVNQRSKGTLAFDSDVVFGPVPKPSRDTRGKQAERQVLEEKIKGVAKVLEAYGVFEDMSYSKQQELLRAIVAVFMSGG